MEENNNEQKPTNEPMPQENQNVENNTVSEQKPEGNLPEQVNQEEVKQEVKFEPMGQVNQKEERKFEPMGQGTKKKGKGGIIALIIILILALLGAGGYYYYSQIYTNPQKVFQNLLANGIDAINEEQEELSKAKVSLKVDADVELGDTLLDSFTSDEEEMVESVLDLVNNTELEIDAQVDMEKQAMLLGVNADYEDDELLKAKMLIDAKKEKAYAELEQFFDKTVEIPLESEDYTELKAAFEQEGIFKSQKDRQKAIEIVKDELLEVIKEEYCSKESEEIEIGDKDIKATKYTLELTEEDLVKEIKAVCKNLKENDKFNECFENSSDVKDALELVIDEMDDITSFNDDNKIIINLYRAGIKQEFVRVDFEVKSVDEEMLVKVEKDKDTYEVTLMENDEKIMSYTMVVTDDKVTMEMKATDDFPVNLKYTAERIDDETAKLEISIDAEDIVKANIKMEISIKTNEDIDSLDTKNAVNINEVTEEDLTKATEKLEKSKLYEIIEEFSTKFEDEDILDDDVFDDDIYNDNLLTGSNTNTSKLTDNQLVTYDGSKTVTFNVQSGFEQGYASDTYKSYDNDDIDVTLSSSYGDEKDYLESEAQTLKNLEKYSSDTSKYSDINVSEQKTVTVNGKTFYYIDASYKYTTSYSEYTYYTKYICIPVSNSYVYTVEVEADRNVEISEIEAFLNIK